MIGPSYFELLLVAISGFTIGLSKSGIPTVALATIPFMIQYIPATFFSGIFLPLLLLGDALAAWHYRKFLRTDILKRTIPSVIMGLTFGTLVLKNVPDDLWLERFIGFSLIILVLVRIFSEQKWFKSNGSKRELGQSLCFVGSASTTISHVGGPFIGIYLLGKRLSKVEFLGTYAVFFFMINCVKMVIYLGLKLVTKETLTYDLIGFPMVIVGSMTGKFLVKYIPQEVFNYSILVLIIIAAIRLII